MIASERFSRIVAMTNEKGFQSTKDLADVLEVTQTTIRRDCEELEKSGLLIRVHGGAKSINQDSILSKTNELKMSNRENISTYEKDIVCKKAASYVKDGDCIFLDGGTSIVKMMHYLNNKRVKVVTHSALITQMDIPPNIELFSIGGKYIPEYSMAVGPMALNQLERFNFDYAFISCTGVDLHKRLVYTVEMDTMAVKQKAMQQALKKYLLIDSSKSKVKGFCSFISSDEFDAVISNVDEQLHEEELPNNYVLVSKNGEVSND